VAIHARSYERCVAVAGLQVNGCTLALELAVEQQLGDPRVADERRMVQRRGAAAVDEVELRAGRHELAHALFVAHARRAQQLRWQHALPAPLGAHRVEPLQPRCAPDNVGRAAEESCAVEAAVGAPHALAQREAAQPARVVQVERVADGAREREHVQQQLAQARVRGGPAEGRWGAAARAGGRGRGGGGG